MRSSGTESSQSLYPDTNKLVIMKILLQILKSFVWLLLGSRTHYLHYFRWTLYNWATAAGCLFLAYFTKWTSEPAFSLLIRVFIHIFKVILFTVWVIWKEIQKQPWDTGKILNPCHLFYVYFRSKLMADHFLTKNKPDFQKFKKKPRGICKNLCCLKLYIFISL